MYRRNGLGGTQETGKTTGESQASVKACCVAICRTTSSLQTAHSRLSKTIWYYIHATLYEVTQGIPAAGSFPDKCRSTVARGLGAVHASSETKRISELR